VSLFTEVTVHCDSCGKWEHCSDSITGKSTAADRKRRGWLIVNDGRTAARADYCPDCAKKSWRL
jgi:hypothetical protein